MAGHEIGHPCAIVMRDGIPVLVEIVAEDEAGIVLVPQAAQPPPDELMAMVEAQGGLHRPRGIFRYDPLLAAAGIRNCVACGAIWQVRDHRADPGFVPVKCPVCQAPLREPLD